MKRAYIEITNRCNLSCAFCMNHERSYRDLSLTEFRHIVDEVTPLTNYLYFHVQGEPMLHPELDQFLDYTDQKQAHVQLVTNGSLLEKHIDLDQHPSLRKISFSLQSIEYQPATDPLVFLKKILGFAEKAAKKGIYCEIRFWRDDQADMPRTKACMDYISSHYPLDMTSRKNSLKLCENVYLSYSNSFSWPDSESKQATNRGTCKGAIDQIAILSDGTVVPCCLDCKGQIALGNILTTPLSEILSSPRYQAMVKGFRNHEITESLCQKCTFRLRFR